MAPRWDDDSTKEEEFRPTLDVVRVNKSELIDILKKNRDAHKEIFEKAFEIYKERITEHLERMLDDAKNGRKVQHQIGLIRPVNYTKEYDRALKQLELSIDDVLYLDKRDFARLVMDDWEWSESFNTSTAAYLVTEA